MPSPAASWNLVRVYGTWHNMDGSLKPGNYQVLVPARVTSTTSDVIVPSGVFASGALQTTNTGAPSLDILVPATDDPSNAQTVLTVTVIVSFSDHGYIRTDTGQSVEVSPTESYVITVPYADRPIASGGTGNGVDLRTVVLPQNIAPSTPLYKVGAAGGLAQLNSSGKVVNADGNVAGAVSSVNGHVGDVTLAASDVSALPFTAADFKPETYGALGNGKMLNDVAITTGTAILTSPGGGFAGATVGQFVYVASAGGFANVPLVTTIASVQSANQVTLAANAAATVTAKGCIYGTDDTAAIQSCINAATTYAQTHGGATLRFSEAIYVVAGALGGTNMRAQLQLPSINPTTAPRKVDLTFKGAREATSYVHWSEPNPPTSGTVLFSMYYVDAAQSISPPPVVIGGPVSGYGGNGGLFSNMRVIVDGLNLLVAHRSCISGLDLFGVAQADIKSLSYHTAAQPSGASGSAWPALANGSSNPSAWQTFAYRSPTVGNNAQNDAGRITAYGSYHGVIFADHFSAKDIGVIAAYAAVTSACSNQSHHSFIGSLTSELTNTPLLCDNTNYGGGAPQPIFIAALQCEDAATFVSDPGNALHGEVHIEQLGTTPPLASAYVNGAKNLRIIYEEVARGPVGTPPAVPASTTALTNPFWRDATVVVSGGTVSQIAVDGVNQGINSGPVQVPTGSSITLTYSVAPTWAWSLR
jgi:hypothetical protein